MLISLVSNTASTVSNTLKILEVAKKTSDQLDKYNFIAMRRFFIARRIEQHARDIAATKKISPKSLQELNQQMLILKTNLSSLKSNIDLMAKDIFSADQFVDRSLEKVINAMEDSKEAYNQELVSASEGSMSKHVQNTAINTALGTKVLTKIRQDNLDYQTSDLKLKRALAKENLRSDIHYRQWIGISANKDSSNEYH